MPFPEITIELADGEQAIPDWIVGQLGADFFESQDNRSMLRDYTLAELGSHCLQIASELYLRDRVKAAIQPKAFPGIR